MFAREIVVVLSVLSAALCCVEYKDCESCAGSEHRVRFSMKSCEWCPLTLKCRTQGSGKFIYWLDWVVTCIIGTGGFLEDAIFNAKLC